jgi:solute carrier family 35, member E1
MAESSPVVNANGTTKFPAFLPDQFRRHSDDLYRHDEPPSPYDYSAAKNAQGQDGQWQPRRHTGRTKWANTLGTAYPVTRHERQKSLSEAIKTIRTRSGSVTQNAKEIADALKAPVSPALVVCEERSI